jgi:hypothetical protein
MIKQEKSGGGLHITIRVKPEVGRNGPFLCGIESLYNGLSETTKVLDIWSQINHIPIILDVLEST